MPETQLTPLTLKIHGTHCASCEVLIERKFKKVDGVKRVKVNHVSGKTELYCLNEPDLIKLQNAIKDHGYTVTLWDENSSTNSKRKNTIKDYAEIGAIFLIVVALYHILKQFDIVPSLGISDNMSLGFVFLIGLVAAMSTCLAVTGGLLLAVAAKYNERHANLTSLQKFKPHLYFNIGRIVSYTVLGGAVGAVGSMITLSGRLNGIVTIFASAVMIVLGFQLLKIFHFAHRFQPKMPKFLSHYIHDISTKDSKFAPFALGAGTFFLPCGFTQALQLYVLTQGSAVKGALTMLIFSLGTLPALLSLSAMSSFAKGKTQGYFLKFAGVIVILVGLFNINNGITLAGLRFTQLSLFEPKVNAAPESLDPNVEIVDGKQIAEMKVDGYDYFPSRFKVRAGMPVEWRIDGAKAAGCAKVITMPKQNITEYLSSDGVTTIEFLPEQAGRFDFSCTMGMTTPGAAFDVVDSEDTAGIGVGTANNPPAQTAETNCNPEIMECIPAQKRTVEVTREKGFFPRFLTVKKNVPVELTVSSKVELRGCMSVMVIPDLNVTSSLKLGENKIAFTPTKSGTALATCSMGSPLFQLTVLE